MAKEISWDERKRRDRIRLIKKELVHEFVSSLTRWEKYMPLLESVDLLFLEEDPNVFLLKNLKLRKRNLLQVQYLQATEIIARKLFDDIRITDSDCKMVFRRFYSILYNRMERDKLLNLFPTSQMRNSTRSERQEVSQRIH